MFKVLVLTHGRLAEVLVDSARMIAGEAPGMAALALEWDDTFEQAHGKVAAAVDRLDEGDGVLILTDMYGGTPFNVARTLAEPGRVEIVTGVNLPMVLRMSCFQEDEPTLARAAEWILAKGQSAMCRCTTAPLAPETEPECD